MASPLDSDLLSQQRSVVFSGSFTSCASAATFSSPPSNGALSESLAKERNRQQRQRVYIGAPSVSPSDVDQHYHWPKLLIDNMDVLDREPSLRLHQPQKIFGGGKSSLNNTNNSVSLASGRSAASQGSRTPRTSVPNTPGSSRSGAVGSSGHRQKRNAMSELDTEHFRTKLWVSAASRGMSDDDRNDVAPDLAMDVLYPPAGFFNSDGLDGDEWAWTIRFNELLNAPDNEQRSQMFDDAIRDFCIVAVPLAVYCINTVDEVPSTIVHHRGITVEFCGLADEVRTLFPASLRVAQKVVDCEYKGRVMAQQAACPQLVVPFTISVEICGMKALVYPRVPVDMIDDHKKEFVYGCLSPSTFDVSPVIASDGECNAVMRKLGARTKHKGHWMGREVDNKKFFDAPFDCRVYRSLLDNRLYAVHLRHLTASTTDHEVASANEYYIQVMRPEFVFNHCPEPLSGDSASPLCFMNAARDEHERAVAVQHLLTYIIPQAAEQMSRDMRLNGVTFHDHLVRGGVRNFMHSWGINLRFLPEMQHKLARTQFSGMALTAIEVEMTARAVKQRLVETMWSSGDGSRLAPQRLAAEAFVREVCAAWDEARWTGCYWAALIVKYPVLADGPKWGPDRLLHVNVLQRFIHVANIRITRGADLLDAQQISPLSSAEIAALRISFQPRVKCPLRPPAPFPEGQRVSLMTVAKRYLRDAAIEFRSANVLRNRPQVQRYMAFLAAVGESKCDEITEIFVIEQAKKESGGRPKVIFEEVSKTVVKYRLKGGKGMREFDISEDAMRKYKLHHNQRVQITLGSKRGLMSTIIGVFENAIWKHDDGEDGADEVIGHNFPEIMANYGLVNLGVASKLRQRLLGGGITRPVVREPLHIVTDRGKLLVIDRHVASAMQQYGFAHGDRLQFRQGPRAGMLTTILGHFDNSLWHQIDGISQVECFRHTDHDALMGLFDLVVFGRRSAVPPHPVDTIASLNGHMSLFAGYRQTLPFGFHYRQVIELTKGPHAGALGVVVGATGGVLHALLQQSAVPVPLGESRHEIDLEHAPAVKGVLSFAPQIPPPEPRIPYGVANGEILFFITACSTCFELSGVVPGQQVKLQEGVNTGNCGVVVGARKGRMWAHFESDTGAVPLCAGTFEVLGNSIFDLPPHADAALQRTKLQNESVAIHCLAEFGEVIAFDVTPAACDRWRCYHGQRLLISSEKLRLHQGVRAMSPDDSDAAAGTVECIVVGAALSELWFQLEREPRCQPFRATDWWELNARYAPRVVGVGTVIPWCDMFASTPSGSGVRPNNFDSSISRDGFRVFILTSGDMVGVDVRDESIARIWSGWYHGTAIVRQDAIVTVNVDGRMVHRPSGPRATVVGAMLGALVVRPQDDDEGRVMLLHAHELPKWLESEDSQAHMPQSLITPVPASHDYAARVGLVAPADEIEGYLWGLRDGDRRHFVPFSETVNHALSALFDAPGGGSIWYDDAGNAYDVDRLTFQAANQGKNVQVLHRAGYRTIVGYLKFCFNIDISPPPTALLCAALEKRACDFCLEHNMRLPDALLYLPSLVKHGGPKKTQAVTYFTDEMLPALQFAVQAAPLLFTTHFETAARGVSASVVKELKMRYTLVPESLHDAVLSWVLDLCGVNVPTTATRTQPLFHLLAAVEEHIGRPLDVPTMTEFSRYVDMKISVLMDREDIAREKLEQEALSTSPVASAAARMDVRRRRSTLLVARRSGLAPRPPSDVAQHYSRAPTGTITDDARYVLETGEILVFSSSSMSLQRGDIVRYTYGDIAGITATILGMLGGQLWRCEHNGFYAHKAMPFEGDEDAIQRRYGLRVVSAISLLPRVIAAQELAKIRRGDDLRFLMWDGTEGDFEVDCETCRRFGAMTGDRFQATRETPPSFPYQDSILVIVGVRNQRLWFAVDQCGAIPFPQDSGNPIADFKLQRLYWATLEPPNLSRAPLFRYYSTLPESEAVWLSEFGTATLLFNTNCAVVASHGCSVRPLQKLLCTAGDFKGFRVVVIGVRHGKLWVIKDQDGAAIPLPCPLEELAPRSIPGELRGGEVSLPLPSGRDCRDISDHVFRFPVHSGTLALFDVSTNCRIRFGLQSGQRFTYVGRRTDMIDGRITEERRIATCIGMRHGTLWRLNDGELIAKPLVGAEDRIALGLKFKVEALQVTPLQSYTW